MTTANPLPDDVEALREMVIALQSQYHSIEKTLQVERAKISALDQYMRHLNNNSQIFVVPGTVVAQNSWMRISINWN